MAQGYQNIFSWKRETASPRCARRRHLAALGVYASHSSGSMKTLYNRSLAMTLGFLIIALTQ